MIINNNKPVEIKQEVMITSQNFTGIGTREIKPNGIQAIKDVYKITFNQK